MLTYHEFMFCLANGNIVRQISAVADRLVGSMLSTEVSPAKTRCIAAACGKTDEFSPANSISKQFGVMPGQSSMSTHLRRRASK
jgi:hypothetical protein